MTLRKELTQLPASLKDEDFGHTVELGEVVVVEVVDDGRPRNEPPVGTAQVRVVSARTRIAVRRKHDEYGLGPLAAHTLAQLAQGILRLLKTNYESLQRNSKLN